MARRGRPNCRAGRLLRAGGHGPPPADPPSGPGMGPDSRGVRDPGLSRGSHREDRTRHTGLSGDVPLGSPAGQDGRHPRRSIRREGLLRHRRRLVRARARRVRPRVSLCPSETGRPRARDRSAPGVLGPGTKPYGRLPETTSYPRPTRGRVPIIVGGGGERRTLDIAARLGDGCNIASAMPALDRKIEVLRGHLERAGRDPADVPITVLDVPIVGCDRDEVGSLVERHRGRQSAAAFVRARPTGTIADHIGAIGSWPTEGSRPSSWPSPTCQDPPRSNVLRPSSMPSITSPVGEPCSAILHRKSDYRSGDRRYSAPGS